MGAFEGQLFADKFLTNLSQRYAPSELIGLQVAPLVPVTKSSGKYYIYDKNEQFRAEDTLISAEGAVNEIKMVLSSDTYSLTDRGLLGFVGQDEIEEADDSIDPESDVTTDITEKLIRATEDRIASIVFNSANYAASNKIDLNAASRRFDDPANATPIEDIQTAWTATAPVKPNTIVFGAQAWLSFRANQDVLNAAKPLGTVANRKGLATPAEVAAVFGVNRVLIGWEQINRTRKNATTQALEYIWGKSALVCHVNPRPTKRSVSLAYTYGKRKTFRQTFKEKAPITKGARGGMNIKVIEQTDEKMVGADVGYLLYNVVA